MWWQSGEDDMSDIDVEERGPTNGPSDNPSQYHNTDGWTSGAGHNGETKEEQGDSNKVSRWCFNN